MLWPVTLIVLASAAQACTSTTCTIDRGSLAVIALSPVLLAIAVFGLERRAPHELGLGDLVGDLTIGTAAILFVVSFVTGLAGFLGPGLLLLLIGSAIFGLVGYLNGARQRLASAIVGIGAGFVIVFLVLAGTGGVGGTGGSSDTTALLPLILFSIGWGWLGVHLLLGRPLPILEREPSRR